MLLEIEAQIPKLDKAILAAHRSDPVSLQLATIPPASARLWPPVSRASVPDASLFQGSREFAAYLGLVPRQHSTGGKARLGSISKMGNRHLRKLLVVGAHAALYRMKSGRPRQPWRTGPEPPGQEAVQGGRRRAGQQDGPDRLGGDGQGHRLTSPGARELPRRRH